MTSSITVDFAHPYCDAPVYAKQGDTGRTVSVKLLDNCVDADLSSLTGGSWIARYKHLPSGKGGEWKPSFSISESTITFTILPNALGLAGKVEMDVAYVVGTSSALASFSFPIMVEEAANLDVEVAPDIYSSDIMAIAQGIVSPIIGDNGDWYTYKAKTSEYVDTGVSAKGTKGDRGEQGPVTVTVGTTTTGEAGTKAKVENGGTAEDVVLNFTIPQGADLTVVSTAVTYQASTSGTEIPSGEWSDTVPTVAQGSYLWTRFITTFSDGSTSNPAYSVSRYGVDGSGSVSSVNSVGPDASGNITLAASNINTSDSSTVQAALTANASDISGISDKIGNTTLPTTAQTLTGAVSELKADLDDKADASDLAAKADKSDLTAKADKSTAVAVILSASSWSSDNTQTVSVSAVTASNNVVVAPSADSFLAYGESQVRATAQSAGTLTFTAETVPTDDLTANVMIVG